MIGVHTLANPANRYGKMVASDHASLLLVGKHYSGGMLALSLSRRVGVCRRERASTANRGAAYPFAFPRTQALS